MITLPYGLDPRDFIRSSIRREAVDKCVAFGLRYKGAQASGKVAIANTTGDMSFTHGAVGSEVADTTVNPSGGTPGTIDLSGEGLTFLGVSQLVNASANWELWPKCALPTDVIEAAGTAKIINNIAATQCKLDAGYDVLIDTSAALYHSIGITRNGSSVYPHRHDAGVYHEITKIAVTTTYASGTSIIYVYEVDDFLGTATLMSVGGIAAAATTVEKVLGDASYALYNNSGRRLVVKVVNSAAMTAADMEVWYGTYVHTPSARKSKMWSNY